MINRMTAAIDLLALREKYKITQAKLSEKTGISVQAISGIESGNKPQSMTLYKLNRYFESIKAE